MSGLLPREQAIIHLAFVAGLSQDQIGDIIGVSGSQVCKIQGRALRKLRSVLEPVYIEHSTLQESA
jgi:RNA polymerase sigma factor (sigma-70 family)